VRPFLELKPTATSWRLEAQGAQMLSLAKISKKLPSPVSRTSYSKVPKGTVSDILVYIYIYIYIHIHTALPLFLSPSTCIQREREREKGRGRY